MSTKQKELLGWLVVVIAVIIAGYLGVSYPIPEPPAEGTLGTTHFSALDVVGTINYGTDDNYPMGYASSGYQIVCGTTAVFTDAVAIDLSGSLSAATYAIASQITAPAATGALLYVSDPTTTTVVITSLESDYTAGTTGVQAHYCAVGTE